MQPKHEITDADIKAVVSSKEHACSLYDRLLADAKIERENLSKMRDKSLTAEDRMEAMASLIEVLYRR